MGTRLTQTKVQLNDRTTSKFIYSNLVKPFIKDLSSQVNRLQCAIHLSLETVAVVIEKALYNRQIWIKNR